MQNSRAIAGMIVRGLDQARAARDREIAMLKEVQSVYAPPPGSRATKLARNAEVVRLVTEGKTYREAAKAVGFKSPSAVHRIVHDHWRRAA